MSSGTAEAIGLAGEAARMKLCIVGGRDEPLRAAAPVQPLRVCLFDEAPSSLCSYVAGEVLGGKVEVERAG